MTYKQMIFIVIDLKMGKGKMVAQGAHASISSFLKNDEQKNNQWVSEGMKKIVLKITTDEVKEIISECKANRFNYSIIHDAGKTQVIEGSLTAISVGPEKEEKLEKSFGKYKLL